MSESHSQSARKDLELGVGDSGGSRLLVLLNFILLRLCRLPLHTFILLRLLSHTYLFSKLSLLTLRMPLLASTVCFKFYSDKKQIDLVLLLIEAPIIARFEIVFQNSATYQVTWVLIALALFLAVSKQL